MDESLKALLLLNSLDLAGMRIWEKIKSKKLPASVLWKENSDKLADTGLTDSALTLLRKRALEKWAENECDKCAELGIRIITYTAEDYPKSLSDLKDPPLLLYWYGKSGSLPGKTIGVVGTRRASSYGRRIAQSIGECCSRYGVGLISGGASGIDGNAHEGTCRTGGVTYAVFGTGVDVAFPVSHKRLFDEIREKGALISEFPLGTMGEPWRFPKRNRIVAALSEKLIVVEAPVKSGSMITARIALEIGREIWAVPGHIDEDVSSGTNRLIFDGAYPFIDNETFFKAPSGQMPLFGEEKPLQCTSLFLGISEEEASVLSLLKLKGERTVDNIALEVKMSAADILKTISILSAKGMVCLSGPGRFSAKV